MHTSHKHHLGKEGLEFAPDKHRTQENAISHIEAGMHIAVNSFTQQRVRESVQWRRYLMNAKESGFAYRVLKNEGFVLLA